VTGRGKRFLAVGAAVVVVSALVALYLSLPYIQARREQARREQCRQNLRKIGIELHLYADDYDAATAKPNASGTAEATQTTEALKLLYQQNRAQNNDGAPSPAGKQEP
jgi:hypothetical protein